MGEDFEMAFISSLTPAQRVAELLADLGQPILSCYPTNLKALLPHADRFSKHLRLVVVHSEQSSPTARELWSEQLGVPVLDEYSSEEATRIALELPCGHYHVCEDAVRLELLDLETMRPQQPGEVGTAVITNLLNTAMPFIRYVQGDLVTEPAAPAACSIGWGQIETVGGRANDSWLAGGREVPAGSVLDITYGWMFDTDTHIREFELVQDRPDVIRARFVPGAGVSQAKVTASVTHLEQLLAVSLEQPMRVEVELVESLPSSASIAARRGATGVARVQAATVLLQGAAPEHLLAVGRLRLEHPQATLEQLGEFADPPMTKDAVAGKLRRLFAVADRRATSLGVPTTQAAVSPELLEAASEDYALAPAGDPPNRLSGKSPGQSDQPAASTLRTSRGY